jgi:hypothetical protein
MPRDGSGVFSSAISDVETNTPISSSVFNAFKDDIVADLNLDRPVAAGGTGASTASAARTSLEVAKAQVNGADTTAGSGLIVGAFGLGGTPVTATDFDAAAVTGFIKTASASTTGAPTTGNIWAGRNLVRSGSEAIQEAFAPGTADSRIRFKASSIWGEWFKWWHAGNLLGTVSQTVGVPTGAVVETGASGSQRYVRWADGTQMLWVRSLTLNNASTSTMNRSVAFMKEFIDATYWAQAGLIPENSGDTPSTIDDFCTPTRAEILAPCIGNTTTTGLSVQVDRILGMTNFASDDRLTVSIGIVGRWF